LKELDGAILFFIFLTYSKGMDILNSIVSGMTKEQVRYFKLFASRSHDNGHRMDVKLFDYMRRSGERYNEEKIVRQLYEGENKNSFYRLRNRLLRDINRSLIVQHFDDDEMIHALHLLALAKFHFAKNNVRASHYFLKKAEAQALRTESYELLEMIYGDFIRLSHEMLQVDPVEYIRLRNDNQGRIRQLREIDDILAVVSHRMKQSQNFSSDENPVLPLLQETVNQYSSDNELKKSPKLRFKIYHAVTQILLQKRNYTALEDYLLNTYSEFEKAKMFSRANHETKLQMLVFLINTLFKNGKLKESLRFADKLLAAMEEFQRTLYDKYLFYYYNSLVINYSRIDRDRAIEILSVMKGIEKIRSVPFYEMFVCLNLAVCYFDKHDYHQSIRHLNKLYTLEGYSTADESLKFKIAIGELIIRYELKNFDVLETKLRQVKKDFKVFFSSKSNSRDILMVNIISRLIESDSLRSDKSLYNQARQHILGQGRKESSDADILNYRNWLEEKLR
jgi:tetratricopeptide (TPR) repeat protein